MATYPWYEYPNTPLGDKSGAIGSGFYKNNYGIPQNATPTSFEQAPTSYYNGIAQTLSTPEYDNGNGGDYGIPGWQEGGKDISQYTDPIANMLFGTIFSGLNTFLPGISVGYDTAKNAATDNLTTGTFLNSLGQWALGLLNPGQAVMSNVSKSNPVLGMLGTKGVNYAANHIWSNLANYLFSSNATSRTASPFYSPTGLTGEVDQGYWEGQPAPYTIGSMENDSYSAIAPSWVDTPIGSLTSDQYNAGFQGFGAYGGAGYPGDIGTTGGMDTGSYDGGYDSSWGAGWDGGGAYGDAWGGGGGYDW